MSTGILFTLLILAANPAGELHGFEAEFASLAECRAAAPIAARELPAGFIAVAATCNREYSI